MAAGIITESQSYKIYPLQTSVAQNLKPSAHQVAGHRFEGTYQEKSRGPGLVSSWFTLPSAVRNLTSGRDAIANSHVTRCVN